MSWVTLDDAAPLHRKQLAAGAPACWLWTCGLAYCDRQEAKDGFIPDPVVKLLYPGLGKKQADKLVTVGLWRKVDGGYEVHDYLHWRTRRYGAAELGRKGGSVSSEAKRQAALKREADKRIAQAQTTSETPQALVGTNHNPDPIRSDPEEIPPTPFSEIQAKATRWLELVAKYDVAKGRAAAEAEYGDPCGWLEVQEICRVFAEIWRTDAPRNGGDPRVRVILERLADGYTVEQIYEAIRGSKLDPNIAENRQFQAIRTVLRDAAQVDKFRALLAAPPPKQADETGGYGPIEDWS